jgi:hypothetical protein
MLKRGESAMEVFGFDAILKSKGLAQERWSVGTL